MFCVESFFCNLDHNYVFLRTVNTYSYRIRSLVILLTCHINNHCCYWVYCRQYFLPFQLLRLYRRKWWNNVKYHCVWLVHFSWMCLVWEPRGHPSCRCLSLVVTTVTVKTNINHAMLIMLLSLWMIPVAIHILNFIFQH